MSFCMEEAGEHNEQTGGTVVKQANASQPTLDSGGLPLN